MNRKKQKMPQPQYQQIQTKYKIKNINKNNQYHNYHNQHQHQNQNQQQQYQQHLLNLQNNLLQVWTQKNVDDYYQNIFLSYLDSLQQQNQQYKVEDQIQQQSQQQQKQSQNCNKKHIDKQIAKQIRLTYQGKSQYFIIKDLIVQRQQVYQSLLNQIYQIEEDIKISSLIDINKKQLLSICDKIDQLRKYNLLISQIVIKFQNGLFQSQQQHNGNLHKNNKKKEIINNNQLDLNHPIFQIMNQDLNIIKNSFLKNYIIFQKSYDPFLIHPYQLIIKNNHFPIKGKNNIIDSLFAMNISYAYRLMKAHNQILKFMSEGNNVASYNQINSDKERQKQQILNDVLKRNQKLGRKFIKNIKKSGEMPPRLEKDENKNQNVSKNPYKNKNIARENSKDRNQNADQNQDQKTPQKYKSFGNKLVKKENQKLKNIQKDKEKQKEKERSPATKSLQKLKEKPLQKSKQKDIKNLKLPVINQSPSKNKNKNKQSIQTPSGRQNQQRDGKSTIRDRLQGYKNVQIYQIPIQKRRRLKSQPNQTNYFNQAYYRDLAVTPKRNSSITQKLYLNDKNMQEYDKKWNLLGQPQLSAKNKLFFDNGNEYKSDQQDEDSKYFKNKKAKKDFNLPLSSSLSPSSKKKAYPSKLQNLQEIHKKYSQSPKSPAYQPKYSLPISSSKKLNPLKNNKYNYPIIEQKMQSREQQSDQQNDRLNFMTSSIDKQKNSPYKNKKKNGKKVYKIIYLQQESDSNLQQQNSQQYQKDQEQDQSYEQGQEQGQKYNQNKSKSKYKNPKDSKNQNDYRYKQPQKKYLWIRNKKDYINNKNKNTLNNEQDEQQQSQYNQSINNNPSTLSNKLKQKYWNSSQNASILSRQQTIQNINQHLNQKQKNRKNKKDNNNNNDNKRNDKNLKKIDQYYNIKDQNQNSDKFNNNNKNQREKNNNNNRNKEQNLRQKQRQRQRQRQKQKQKQKQKQYENSSQQEQQNRQQTMRQKQKQRQKYPQKNKNIKNSQLKEPTNQNKSKLNPNNNNKNNNNKNIQKDQQQNSDQQQQYQQPQSYNKSQDQQQNQKSNQKSKYNNNNKPNKNINQSQINKKEQNNNKSSGKIQDKKPFKNKLESSYKGEPSEGKQKQKQQQMQKPNQKQKRKQSDSKSKVKPNEQENKIKQFKKPSSQIIPSKNLEKKQDSLQKTVQSPSKPNNNANNSTLKKSQKIQPKDQQKNNQIKNGIIKPGKVQSVNLKQYLNNSKISPIYKKIFETDVQGKWIQALKQHTSFLTQFWVGTNVAAFGISQPLPASNAMSLKYWGFINGICDQSRSQHFFKKYIEYIQKYSTVDFLFYRGKGFDLLQKNQFTQIRSQVYQRKRTNPSKKQKPQYDSFLSFEISQIKFQQKNKQGNSQKQVSLYSEQIQAFSLQNSSGNKYLLQVYPQFIQQSIIKLQKLPQLSQKKILRYYKQIKDMNQINKILQENDFDTYQVAPDMIVQNINMMTFKTHSTLKSNFCIENHYIKAPAVINNHFLVKENEKEKYIYQIQFSDYKMKCYFGSVKGFKTVDEFSKSIYKQSQNPKNKPQIKRQKLAIKMFSKQLYGQIKTQSIENYGLYGNWQINFLYQPQLHGKVKVTLDNCVKFGPQPFFMALFVGEVLIVGIKVSQQDFIQ